MFLLKTKNELNNKIIKLNLEIEALKSKHESEVNKLKLQHESNLSLLKEENILLKGQNKFLEFKLNNLEDAYEYFASWVNTSQCQIIADTFARNRISLPPLDSKEIYAFAEMGSTDKVL